MTLNATNHAFQHVMFHVIQIYINLTSYIWLFVFYFEMFYTRVLQHTTCVFCLGIYICDEHTVVISKLQKNDSVKYISSKPEFWIQHWDLHFGYWIYIRLHCQLQGCGFESQEVPQSCIDKIKQLSIILCSYNYCVPCTFSSWVDYNVRFYSC